MYSIASYGRMILDSVRMEGYVRALREAVTPDSVVLDIGTGTGIFALLACRFGARQVFAIDPTLAIGLAEELAAANGCADRIRFFRALSTQVTLPERADVLICDLRGVLPFFGTHLADLADARERLLMPGARMIPRGDSLWMAVVRAEEKHRAMASPWIDNPYGLDMGAAWRLESNRYTRASFVASDLLTEPVCCGTIDYQVARSTRFVWEASLPVVSAAEGHGLVLWFESELAEGITLSNAPGSPPLIYGNAFFPWPSPVRLSAGDLVSIKLRADPVDGDYVWSWQTAVHASAAPGSVTAQFRQSELLGAPLSPAELRRRAASHVPRLDDEGRIDLLILARMAEGGRVEDIAREVAAGFPQRFARWEDSLARVGDLAVRYGK